MFVSDSSAEFSALALLKEDFALSSETLPEDSGDRIGELLQFISQHASGATQPESPDMTTLSPSRIQSLTASLSDDLTDVLDRAEGGDPGARLPLRALLEQAGDAMLTMKSTDQTIDALLESSYGINILAAELARKEANTLRASLAGPYPSALDSLLVDQVVICWIQTNYHERLYALMLPKLRNDQHRVYQERIDHAQRRLLRASKTLAQVRKLQLPTPTPLQVNIATQGGQQINVATD